MKAVQWFGRGDLRVVDVPAATAPGPGELLLDVAWCGLCGTDVEEYADGPIAIAVQPHSLTGLSAPITVGHEVSAIVSAAGPGTTVPVGTAVALDGYVVCGSCHECLAGAPNRCERWAFIGMSLPGGLAEQLTVPESMAIPAPDTVALDELALAEPFAVAVRAVRRASSRSGAAVVVGGGTIGLAVAQVARALHGHHITVVERSDLRRSIAVELGFTVAASLAEVTPSSATVLWECSGSTSVLESAPPLVRAGGTIVLVGIPVERCLIDIADVVLRELSLVGTVGHVLAEDTRLAVDLIASGRVDARRLISHRIPLERAVDDGIAHLAGPGRETAMKILVHPRTIDTSALTLKEHA